MPFIPQFTDESLDTFFRCVVRHYHDAFPGRHVGIPPQPSADNLHLLRTILGMYVEHVNNKYAWDEAESQAVSYVASLMGAIRKAEEEAEHQERERRDSILFRLKNAADGSLRKARCLQHYSPSTAKQRVTLGRSIKQ